MSGGWSFAPEAFEEARAAAAYYEDQRKGPGFEFYDALERTLDMLVEEPFHATVHPWAPRDLGLMRFRMRRFPYVVVLASDAEDTLILAVAHVRREPLYWLARARPR